MDRGYVISDKNDLESISENSGDLSQILALIPHVSPSWSDVTEQSLVRNLGIYLADFPYLPLARRRGGSPGRPDEEFRTYWHGSLTPFAQVFTVCYFIQHMLQVTLVK